MTKRLEIINNTPNEFKIMKKKTTKYLHAKNKNNVNMKNSNFCDTYAMFSKAVWKSIVKEHPTFTMREVNSPVSELCKEVGDEDRRMYQQQAKENYENYENRTCTGLVYFCVTHGFTIDQLCSFWVD